MNFKSSDEFLLFSGTSHPALAADVADYLGGELGGVSIETFPDGEISLQVLDNVRGRDVFVLQTVALNPNHYLMELLIFVDALKRASANSVNVVMPYFGYSRQDRKDKPRVAITAKLVADMLEKAGVSHLLTVDLHAEQIQGFFNIPVENLFSRPLLVEAMGKPSLNSVVVAPDAGSVKLARDYAALMGADVAVLDKTRLSPNLVKVVTSIGDIEGKDVLLADDMCSTAGTLASAAKACQEKGAKRIFAAVTHGIFVGDSVMMIEKSPIEALYVSDTIPPTERLAKTTKIKYVSVAPLLGQAIHCMQSHESVSSLTSQKGAV